MNCPNCNTPLAENEQFCTACGAKAATGSAAAPAEPIIVNAPAQRPITREELPSQFRVLSPWAYFGLQILYSVPIVGFVFLLIHTFSDGNLNRRSFARSYWCGLLIVGGAALIITVLCVLLGLYFAPVRINEMPAMIN